MSSERPGPRLVRRLSRWTSSCSATDDAATVQGGAAYRQAGALFQIGGSASPPQGADSGLSLGGRSAAPGGSGSPLHPCAAASRPGAWLFPDEAGVAAAAEPVGQHAADQELIPESSLMPGRYLLDATAPPAEAAPLGPYRRGLSRACGGGWRGPRRRVDAAAAGSRGGPWSTWAWACPSRPTATCSTEWGSRSDCPRVRLGR